MKFAFAISCVKREPDNSLTPSLASGMTTGTNKDEALGKVFRMAHKVYPGEKGYFGHLYSVCPETQVTEPDNEGLGVFPQ